MPSQNFGPTIDKSKAIFILVFYFKGPFISTQTNYKTFNRHSILFLSLPLNAISRIQRQYQLRVNLPDLCPARDCRFPEILESKR